MKRDEIRIGLVGFGAMGKTHTFAVEALPFFCPELPFHAKIAGIATGHLETAKAAAEAHGIPLFTDRPEALIENPDIDVIDICTPNIHHEALIRAALAAGKHIYCEKPLCSDAATAEELAALATRSGRICTVVFNNRHLSPVLRAKQLIDEGRLGEILSFDFSYLHNSCLFPERPAGWKQTAEICGKGGVLFDLGSHIIDLAVFLCGELETVNGKEQIAFHERRGKDGGPWHTDAPEAFYMLAKAKNGAIGTLTASKLCSGANDDLSFAIRGTKGALRFSLMQPNFLEFYDATREGQPYGGESGFTKIECVGRYPSPAGVFPSPKAPQGWLRGHIMSMYHFLDAVHKGKQNAPDFRDAAYVQRIMDAALRSAADGCEKKV